MMVEINRSKQILVNNGYSNRQVDTEIRKLLNNTSRRDTTTPRTQHRIFYKNFMTTKYKQSERAIKDAITSNLKVKDPSSDCLQIVIYYKATKTKNLIMRNNMTPKVRDIAKTHLVYDFRCKEGECAHLPNKQTRYTGLTTCTLSRRLSLHLQNLSLIHI